MGASAQRPDIAPRVFRRTGALDYFIIASSYLDATHSTAERVPKYGFMGSVPDMLRGREGEGENIGYVLQDKMRGAAAWQKEPEEETIRHP